MEDKKEAQSDSGNVKVVCRFRPVNQSELSKNGEEQICQFSDNQKSVTILCSKNSGGSAGSNKFTFDRVFDTQVTQREVYEKAAKPIIEGVLKGFNGTVFAYGQTGSGKTHTMQGPDIEDLEQQGIVPRMVRTIFNRINSLDDNVEYTIKVSMAEIYMEKIKDLLDPTKVNLKIKKDKDRGIYVQDLTEQYIASETDVYDIMKVGNDNRTVASTQMNDASSRSHSIFIMNIAQNNLDDHSSKSGNLYLVDLAGSEKVAKTNVRGTQLEEAKGINQSLSTLGKVIHALTDKKTTHVPYRESKLTRILTESLGGNAKTCLIITCSPSPYNELETISTLRFGTAARNIKNKPKVNREYTVAELKLIVSKKDKLISALRKRILFLENFIKENGLEVPSDETLKELAKKLGPEVDKIIQEEQEMNDEEEKENSEEEKNDEEKIDTGDYVEFDIPPQEQLEDLEESKIDEDDSNNFIDEEQKEKAQKFLQLVESNTGNSSETQAKILEEYLKAQKLLTQEREKCQNQVDLISNLQEDQQIFQSKIQKLSLVKEDFDNYKEATEQKVNELKEETEDAKNELEITNAKMTKVERELAEIKKLYVTAKAKVERYEEKGTEFMIDESKQNKEFRKEVIEGDEVIRMEIKALHDQIAERDQLLNQIQQNPDVSSDLKAIIEESQHKLFEQEKQAMADSDNPLLKKFLIEGGDIDLVPKQDSCYLAPSDVERIIAKQKEDQKLLSKKKKKVSKLKKENSALQAKVASLANIEKSDLEAIADAMAEDKLEDIKEEFTNEKEKIMESLQNRIEKVLQLEMEIDIHQEQYAKLRDIVDSDHTGKTKIMLNYEKNIESLNLIYQQTAGELAAMKVEMKVSQKQVKSLTKKLEKTKTDLKKKSDENKNLRRIASKLRDAVENENFVHQRNTVVNPHHRTLRKVIKKTKKF
ncbi:unnamed protein product [Moneuplotes crassus]|uniref:Kinesin motor domain-containing protein n=1 Tax=Euplotes crassus TaxID=5936 RepID=A0AAD1Y4H2_EUPCR|nr:unnamed protein product [Moneuplotes crassus]